MRWQLMCHHPAGILETETKNVLVPIQPAMALSPKAMGSWSSTKRSLRQRVSDQGQPGVRWGTRCLKGESPPAPGAWTTCCLFLFWVFGKVADLPCQPGPREDIHVPTCRRIIIPDPRMLPSRVTVGRALGEL